ncbi:hypothetical protein DERF_003834 [Dermatophagoides farinae]|uniref:Uncharacterized protein n=1 Tax=Dermatophagoides farinae TaxID=6954 RepID=A0A922LBT8_DERFA|nr:hypothetical protein DERF_003834 [Dermatophagoides farinae]
MDESMNGIKSNDNKSYLYNTCTNETYQYSYNIDINIMSDASLATSVPAMPMAKPTSAIFNAGASFVPSPVTATTSLADVIRLAIICLTRIYLSIGDERANTLLIIPHLFAIDLAVSILSPVIIRTVIPDS